jgi:hypothetical protein
MKIFSNFNTSFEDKILEDNYRLYTKDQVFISKRSKYYLTFYVFPRFIAYIIALMVLFLVLSYFSSHTLIYLFVFLIWLIIFWFQVVYKLLKYICDFTVITPWWITTYKQIWILHSVLKELPSKRIKAVEIFRSSLLWNIFGYGSVDIIADMNDTHVLDVDNEAPWVTELTYVDDPHIIKSKISEICFR